MSEEHTETNWLNLLKSGDGDAAHSLWERYFRRLLGLARKKLASGSRRVADEEDVVVSAFHSFCRGAAAEKFERLEDRNDLWQVLAMITSRKASRQHQRQQAAKRGGGSVRGESVFGGDPGTSALGNIQDASSGGPSPEFVVMMDDEFEALLERLPDDELRQVALARLEGYSNDEIADQIGRHVRSVERKLQLIRQHWSDAAE